MINPLDSAKGSLDSFKTNIIGLGGGGPVSSPSVALDQTTKGLIDAQMARGQRSDEDVAREMVGGTGAANKLQLGGDYLQQTGNSLGMADNAGLRQALGNRSQKYFDSSQTKLLNQARAQAPQMKAQSLAAAQGNLQGAEQATFGAFERDRKAEQNRVAARNATIGSVLGLAGAGAGAYFGGGAGAKAGGALGSAAAGGNTEQQGY